MALHRFRARALSLILHSQPTLPASHTSPIFSLDRRLCSAESSVSSPSPFTGTDYLVSRCGLTRAQAVKASKRISHLSSPSQPEAVLAFLGGTLGIPTDEVSALIVMYPSILCANVERTLAPRVAELFDLGLSREEIARLIPLAPISFHSRFLRRSIEFWLKELGSFDKLLQVVRMNSCVLCSDLDRVTAPNVALLRQCGLSVSEISAVSIYSARLYTMRPEVLQEAVKRVEELGVKRGARMFPRALVAISLRSKEFFTRRIQLLQKFGFSQVDALDIVRIAPAVLNLSDQKVQGNMDFLMKEVGLGLSYIARRPALLAYSVERRLLPRHRLLKVIREKGLLNIEFNYYTTVSMPEKKFLRKLVLAYEDAVPGLADVYASKCLGKAAADKVTLQEK